MNRNKRNRYKLLIHVRTADLCTRGGFEDGGNDLSLMRVTFVLNLTKLIRFLSEIHGMIQNSKIVKISNRSVFPELQPISQPMTHFSLKTKGFSIKLLVERIIE